mmetsp:Transcript_44111/g.122134  ORF Transcript_44111/g.122134 Transcript_44111/m.122134 type:complete len:214 (+) Transcript_44111:786-1427(+)
MGRWSPARAVVPFRVDWLHPALPRRAELRERPPCQAPILFHLAFRGVGWMHDVWQHHSFDVQRCSSPGHWANETIFVGLCVGAALHGERMFLVRHLQLSDRHRHPAGDAGDVLLGSRFCLHRRLGVRRGVVSQGQARVHVPPQRCDLPHRPLLGGCLQDVDPAVRPGKFRKRGRSNRCRGCLGHCSFRDHFPRYAYNLRDVPEDGLLVPPRRR